MQPGPDAYVYFTANGILAFENIHSNLEYMLYNDSVAFPYLLKLDAYNQFTTEAAPIWQPQLPLPVEDIQRPLKPKELFK